MSKELRDRFVVLCKRLEDVVRPLDIEGKRKRIADIDQQSHVPQFWSNQREAQRLTKERDGCKALIAEVDAERRRLTDVEASLDLLDHEESSELEAETQEQLEEIARAIDAMEFRRMLSGEADKSGAILMINAGAGGTEACDWAEILLRMYRRWAERKGYKSDVVDFTEGDGAGFRSVTLTVAGEYAYGYLKAENGVHRLVRISPFDANKRRHTSFASVYAIPDIEEEIQIEIRPEDLRVDTFRSGGAGGQKVNKTDSAVRLTHLPTNTVVACQTERSQHQNKATAMRLLRARLYDLEMEKKRKELDAIEKTKKRIEWGSQIRSYVMQPYQMVKDHRTGCEVGNVQQVMDGDLDEFMKRFLLEGSS